MSTATTTDKITLYWLEDSKAHRILWLLEELNLPYDLKIYKRVNGIAPAELKQVNGLGKAPIVIIEPASNPSDKKVLFESGLITEYLIDRYGNGKLKPPAEDEAATLKYKFHLYYAEGGPFQPLFLHFILNKLHASVPFFIKPVTSRMIAELRARWLDGTYDDHFGFVERELERNRFLVGEEFTGADVINSFNWDVAEGLGVLDQNKYPKLVAYVQGLKEREAYKRAKDKVRDYNERALNKL